MFFRWRFGNFPKPLFKTRPIPATPGWVSGKKSQREETKRCPRFWSKEVTKNHLVPKSSNGHSGLYGIKKRGVGSEGIEPPTNSV